MGWGVGGGGMGILRDARIFFVHVRCKYIFFFLSHIFFWPKTVGIHFFINNFLGKTFFCVCPTPSITFLMVHPVIYQCPNARCMTLLRMVL